MFFISLVKASISRAYKVDAQNYRYYSHISEWKFLDLTLFQLQKMMETAQ